GAGRGSPPGDQDEWFSALLSAASRTRRFDWRRGADPLAPFETWLFVSCRIHSSGRGNRADFALGKLGAGNGLPTDCGLGQAERDGPHHGGGEYQLAEIVLTTLDRTGANLYNIEMELTESMFVENVEDVIARMRQLKSHGLKFSLDDFGTGYSSLAYLRRLPLDQLKIDREFVREILVDASSGAIAQAIISLSRAMGLSVIAEGVETEGQRDFLARLGCHAFQGFLFSGPVPLEEVQRLLAGLA